MAPARRHPWRRAKGAERCSAPGCAAADAVRCAYVDHSGRRCGTAWCGEHRDSVDHVTYCRRHAGVVRGLAPTLVSALPALENRAPSLVHWVGRMIDHDVRAVLLQVLPAGTRVRPERVVPRRRGQTRVWVQGWCARGPGVELDVRLEVSERADTVVVLRAGSRALISAEPPWISARVQGAELTRARARAARTLFYNDLLIALERHVAGVERVAAAAR